jgi:uncharacterized protein (TIGR02466 family)
LDLSMQWAPDTNLKLLRAATDLAHKAAAEFPDCLAIRITLARLLLDQGDARASVDCLRETASRLPDSVELRLTLAYALVDQDAFEEALSEARGALALAPDDKNAKVLYFELLIRTKDWETAGKLADDIAILSPGNERLMAYYFRSRGAEAVLSHCDGLLAENPAHTDAQYFKALMLAKLGRAREAHELISLGRLIDISNLPLPAGYDDTGAFREALANEITRNPTLAFNPRGKATCDGLQTRQLRQPGAVAVEALVAQIKQAVDAYERHIAGLPYGFAIGRPARARLQSWAVVYGSDGRQTVHRHPGGWLSGVFYVAAPRPQGENSYRGPLVIGAVDPVEGVEPPWGTMDVEPVPGRLVMFPSYLPHATEPTGIEGARISVAFDVIPATSP